MHKHLGFDLFAQRFPRNIAEDHELDEEESATRPPLNYGEAAIVLPGTSGNQDKVSRFFQTLYEGLTKEQRAWMPYEDPDTRFPLTFHPFDNALNKDHDLMMAIITPRAIPVNFFGSGKASNLTYEFYNPSALASQLAFGQLPTALCYADVVKPRETISSGLEWIRIAQLPPNADTSDIDLSAWIPALFITQVYKQWWAEWKEHLFYRSAFTYRGMIDSAYKVPDNTVSLQPMIQSYYFLLLSATYFLYFTQVDDTLPSVSRSGRPIELPSGPISLIGNNAPSLVALMHRGARFKKITIKRTKTSPSVAAAALVQVFKVENFYLFNLHRSHSILIRLFQDTSAGMGTSSVTFSTIIPLILCYTRTKTFIVVSANWQIGQDQKH